MFQIRRISFLAALTAIVAWAATGLAEEPTAPRDEALDNLLNKLDEQAKPPAGAETSKADAPGPSGEVETKDKALDSLLEKLGETPDEPSPDDRPKGPMGPHDEPPPPPTDPDRPAPDQLKEEDKDFDKHLEELTGRKPKKKNARDDEESGPLADVIKEMREVEERLGKPDTSEETRKKQSEIVRNLEELIEQLRNAPSQSLSRKRVLTMQRGSQPGSKSGSTPGAQAGHAPRAKPAKPETKRPLTGGEELWGSLPPALRQELENVSKEEALSTKEELIRRYYLSLSKKSRNREE